MLEKQSELRLGRKSFWSRLKSGKTAQVSDDRISTIALADGKQQPSRAVMLHPHLRIIPETPPKSGNRSTQSTQNSDPSRSSNASSRRLQPNVLAGTVFTHTPADLSLSMPPSVGMAFSHSVSSSVFSRSGTRSPGSMHRNSNGSSLRKLRGFAEKFGIERPPHDKALSESTFHGQSSVSGIRRPGLIPWMEMRDARRGRNDTYLSSCSVPALSYGHLTASSTSLLSAQWPASAPPPRTAGSDTDTGPSTSKAGEPGLQIKAGLQAKSPMMMTAPSSSGKSEHADFGMSLGLGAFGNMVLMDAYDAGYLGAGDQNGEQDGDFAQAVEARLKEIIDMAV